MAKTPSQTSPSAARSKAAAKKKRPRVLEFWYDFKDGRALSLKFFKHNGWIIMLAIIGLIWLMSQRYSNHAKMQEINKLEKELRRVKSEEIDAKANYMNLIRENEMRKLMRDAGLHIDYGEAPPYVVASQEE